jgi:hypothetical protein
MNMQLREADLETREPVGARPPWWIHPLRRRAVLFAGLTIAVGLAAAGALFWVWYTTLCGSCGSSSWRRTYPPRLIERIDPPKIVDRVTPAPVPAPQGR